MQHRGHCAQRLFAGPTVVATLGASRPVGACINWRPCAENIRTLYNFEPPTTRDEMRAAAEQIRPEGQRDAEALAGERGSVRPRDRRGCGHAARQLLADLVRRTARDREATRERRRARGRALPARRVTGRADAPGDASVQRGLVSAPCSSPSRSLLRPCTHSTPRRRKPPAFGGIWQDERPSPCEDRGRRFGVTGPFAPRRRSFACTLARRVPPPSRRRVDARGGRPAGPRAQGSRGRNRARDGERRLPRSRRSIRTRRRPTTARTRHGGFSRRYDGRRGDRRRVGRRSESCPRRDAVASTRPSSESRRARRSTPPISPSGRPT